METKLSTKIALFLSGFYILWYIYERIVCGPSCWGNDLFFSIPAMALVPASLEGNITAKYLVVIANAALLFIAVYSIGWIIASVVSSVKKIT